MTLLTNNYPSRRPRFEVVLAISADGKIADAKSTAARFASAKDKAHLEQRIAAADGVLFGASTLRAYRNSLGITDPQLLESRAAAGKPPQPVQIVCSRQAEFDPQWRFFQQPFPRWLLTTPAGSDRWQGKPEFKRILFGANPSEIDWQDACYQFTQLEWQAIAVLGGGELVASLLALDLVDELYLTICPLLLGGKTAPTPVAGAGFAPDLAPRLEIVSVEVIEQEIFVHYRRDR